MEIDISIPTENKSIMSSILAIAATIVIIFAAQAASSILVPFLFAVFLSIIFMPLVNWLSNYRVPLGFSVLIVVLLIISILTITAIFISAQIAGFTERLPFYEDLLNQKVTDLAANFGQELTVTQILNQFELASPMTLAANLFNGMQGLFANFVLIILSVIFLLLEASTFPAKIGLITGWSSEDPDYFKRFTFSMQHYLSIKTVISFFTGLLATAIALLVGLDYALLWGLLAFLLNYIPNIGSLIAAVPPVILAFIQLGILESSLVALGYLAINLLIGGILEPRIMGRRLGLSTLVVFLSLVFWGWVFGAAGMLLSVPLTMIVKIALESSSSTSNLARILGDDSL